MQRCLILFLKRLSRGACLFSVRWKVLLLKDLTDVLY